MFGHAATENVKSGRAQIRERLRMKLKRRSVQEVIFSFLILGEKLKHAVFDKGEFLKGSVGCF